MSGITVRHATVMKHKYHVLTILMLHACLLRICRPFSVSGNYANYFDFSMYCVFFSFNNIRVCFLISYLYYTCVILMKQWELIMIFVLLILLLFCYYYHDLCVHNKIRQHRYDCNRLNERAACQCTFMTSTFWCHYEFCQT